VGREARRGWQGPELVRSVWPVGGRLRDLRSGWPVGGFCQLVGGALEDFRQWASPVGRRLGDFTGQALPVGGWPVGGRLGDLQGRLRQLVDDLEICRVGFASWRALRGGLEDFRRCFASWRALPGGLEDFRGDFASWWVLRGTLEDFRRCFASWWASPVGRGALGRF
jgi:hypothetical protein